MCELKENVDNQLMGIYHMANVVNPLTMGNTSALQLQLTPSFTSCVILEHYLTSHFSVSSAAKGG
jgi:hypothetical protein